MYILDVTKPITTVQEGREKIELLDQIMNSKLEQMRNNDNNAEYQMLRDEHYELRKMKQIVKNQMIKLFDKTYRTIK